MAQICIDETRTRKRVGSGHAVAPGAAGWLGDGLAFAAAPTFALMALWTGLYGGEPDLLCAALGASPFGGMTVMYLLMSGFHLTPWLRLLRGAAGGRRVP